MCIENGLHRHSEVNLLVIIAACTKGGNKELLERAIEALKEKKLKSGEE